MLKVTKLLNVIIKTYCIRVKIAKARFRELYAIRQGNR